MSFGGLLVLGSTIAWYLSRQTLQGSMNDMTASLWAAAEVQWLTCICMSLNVCALHHVKHHMSCGSGFSFHSTLLMSLIDAGLKRSRLSCLQTAMSVTNKGAHCSLCII